MRVRGVTAGWVVGATAGLLVACGGPAPTVEDPTTPAPTTAPAPRPADDTAVSVAAVVDATGSCDELHQLAVSLVTRDAERARTALPDVAGIDDLIDTFLDEDVPDSAFGNALGLQPARPYGGVAGPGVEARYQGLGCSPDDEYPVLRDWFGLPPDDDPSAGLEEVVTSLLADVDAGGFGVLGLARRLIEGAPTSADRAHMIALLRSAVEAQERHHDRTGTYADTEQALVDEGLDPSVLDVEGDAWLWVWEGDAEAYCMAVSGARGSGHVESHDAEPVVEDRPHPCPHTYAERYAVPTEDPTD